MSRKILGCIMLLLVSSCGDTQPKPSSVRIVSWGGSFQSSLIDNWVEPASERAGIQIETESWAGDYSALTTRIKRGLNNWDVVHVEAMYVMSPDFKELFQGFPNRTLVELGPQVANDSIVADLVTGGYAAPVLEYAYLIAGRTDLVTQKDLSSLTWSDFWDLEKIQGHRGMRDFPIGNIEAALASKGYDVESYLYEEEDPIKVEEKVREALQRLDEITPEIIWWTSGNFLQQGMESGDMVLAAAWSGRVLSAARNLCDIKKSIQDCVLQASAQSAFISTDWWIIPLNAPNGEDANKLLTALYDQNSINGAREFSLDQGYTVPVNWTPQSSSQADEILKMGSTRNESRIARINEKFWGKYFFSINQKWLNWRLSSQ